MPSVAAAAAMPSWRNWLAQRTFNPWVLGSSPRGGTRSEAISMVSVSCSVIIGALIWPHEGVNEANSLSSFYRGPGLGGHDWGDPAKS